jgi:N-glycosidase YbiA
MGNRKIIKFYRTSDPFGEFSNFAAFPIRLKGVVWPTTEHYFQAQKFVGSPHEETLRLADSPMTVAKMGRERSRPLRSDWEAVKDDIMREAVFAKFAQHPSLLKLLLSTGDAEIIEHTKNDSYWGDGGDGSGRNMLGCILMEVRKSLSGNGPSFGEKGDHGANELPSRIEVPRVESWPHPEPLSANPREMADYLLTRLIQSGGMLHADYADTRGSWFIRQRVDQNKTTEELIAENDHLHMFRAVLARFGGTYLENQLYGGFGHAKLQQDGNPYDITIFMANDGFWGYWLRAYCRKS